MEIILKYSGSIPGQNKTAKGLASVWKMRSEFSKQLEKLWGKEPFTVLKEWENSDFAAGAPHFTRPIGDATFVPYYGHEVGIGVKLQISILNGFPTPKPLLHAGDLDNRFKRVIDALRAPKPTEIPPDVVAHGRYYVVMEDDDVVTEVHAETGMFLASDDPKESFVMVRVQPTPLRVTMDNLAMLI